MNKSNIDRALGILSDELKAITASADQNPLRFVEKLPFRSLSGNHISGGKIDKFSSIGITDRASKEQLKIDDDGVHVEVLTVQHINGAITHSGDLNSNNIKAVNVTADVIHAGKIIGDIEFSKDESIVFAGDRIAGKGLLWTGKGNAKQLVFATDPDKFFSSENIDLAKDRYYSVNNIKVLDDKELGPTVVKSNLRELGRLKGLIVDGSFVVNNYFYYNSNSDRIGLGTDEPKAALSLVEDGVEVIIGTKDSSRGMIGTFASQPFDIVTDGNSRLSISHNGNILLGNTNLPPVQVSVHGKLAIRVAVPDPSVDLHVNGPIKFHGHSFQYADQPPQAGDYNVGDIFYNTKPRIDSYVGWVCVRAGNPGEWEPFGKIGNQ